MGSTPIRQGLANQPEASLAWGTATCLVKRRQRIPKPRDRAPKLPQCWCPRFPINGDNTELTVMARLVRTGRGPRAGQRYGKDSPGTWEVRF